MTRQVVKWYLVNYFGKAHDPGTVRMFNSSEHVGHFAVAPEDVRAGCPKALFRLLVATTMFQRLRDALVLKILRGISVEDAAELTSTDALLGLASSSACEHTHTLDALVRACDLTKDEAGLGVCEARPGLACYLKRHTVLLKRYGHFGKVPTAAALALESHGVSDLRGLRRKVLRTHADPLERAIALEEALSESWRISKKIASMFLSAVANPDLSRGTSPWSRGIDWTHFVVCDSNVDAYLTAIGYPGPWSYDARRRFVQALARAIDLRACRRQLRSYNPRLVQQAIYVFTGASNRREHTADCSFLGQEACRTCPQELTAICPVRPSTT